MLIIGSNASAYGPLIERTSFVTKLHLTSPLGTGLIVGIHFGIHFGINSPSHHQDNPEKVEEADVQNEDKKAEETQQETQQTADNSLVQASLVQEYLIPCLKPLVRLIASSHREIQQLVLSSIVSLTEEKSSC